MAQHVVEKDHVMDVKNVKIIDCEHKYGTIKDCSLKHGIQKGMQMQGMSSTDLPDIYDCLKQ